MYGGQSQPEEQVHTPDNGEDQKQGGEIAVGCAGNPSLGLR